MSHPHGSKSKHGTITQFCVNVGPASKTVGQYWNSINWVNAMCLLMPASQTIDRHWTSNGLRSWPNIERYCVGRLYIHHVYEIHRTDAYTELVLHGCCPEPTMVMEGIDPHFEDILVSLVLSLIYPGHLGFWSMMTTNTVMFTKYYAIFCLKRPNRLKPGLEVWIAYSFSNIC